MVSLAENQLRIDRYIDSYFKKKNIPRPDVLTEDVLSDISKTKMCEIFYRMIFGVITNTPVSHLGLNDKDAYGIISYNTYSDVGVCINFGYMRDDGIVGDYLAQDDSSLPEIVLYVIPTEYETFVGSGVLPENKAAELLHDAVIVLCKDPNVKSAMIHELSHFYNDLKRYPINNLKNRTVSSPEETDAYFTQVLSSLMDIIKFSKITNRSGYLALMHRNFNDSGSERDIIKQFDYVTNLIPYIHPMYRNRNVTLEQKRRFLKRLARVIIELNDKNSNLLTKINDT